MNLNSSGLCVCARTDRQPEVPIAKPQILYNSTLIAGDKKTPNKFVVRESENHPAIRVSEQEIFVLLYDCFQKLILRSSN
jgi:hypothetical protein